MMSCPPARADARAVVAVDRSDARQQPRGELGGGDERGELHARHDELVRASLAAFPTLWLNELVTVNSATLSNAVADRFGEYEPWVERTTAARTRFRSQILSRHELHSTDALGVRGRRDASARRIQTHLARRRAGRIHRHGMAHILPRNAGAGSLALTYVASGQTNVLDYLNYNVPSLRRSYGNYPDANVSGRRQFSVITPGATNNPAALPIQFISTNGWRTISPPAPIRRMASSRTGLKSIIPARCPWTWRLLLHRQFDEQVPVQSAGERTIRRARARVSAGLGRQRVARTPRTAWTCTWISPWPKAARQSASSARMGRWWMR